MGCLKLTYRSETPTLKVVWNSLKNNEKGCAGVYRFGFGGHEKVDEVTGTSGTCVDMGDRWLDTRIGRTLKLDIAKSLYTSISPYAYAMNTPIQAIDPDGKVVIFINGLWGPWGGVNLPNESYWGLRWVKSLQKHWNDLSTPLFFDGSVGGQRNLENNISPTYRWRAGKDAGYKNASSIIGNLSAGETIKFVTNSMGAAFQRGFSEGLKQYILEQQCSNLDAQKDVMASIKAIENQMKDFGSLPIVDNGLTYEDLQNNLKTQKQKLSSLKADYQRLENITIELVVDIEPQDQTNRDPNAQNHYYIKSDRSKYNFFERNFLNIQPVSGAIDASTKNGKSVTRAHHPYETSPSDLPKP